MQFANGAHCILRAALVEYRSDTRIIRIMLSVLVLAAIVGFFGGLFVLGALLVWQTAKRRGRFGINYDPDIKCPNCGFQKPNFGPRNPQDLTEILWGGFTCPGCGAKVDKWGKRRK